MNNIRLVTKNLIIGLLYTFIISLLFLQNVLCTDLICKKTNKNSKDLVQKSKELKSTENPDKITINYPNHKQEVIWKNPDFIEDKSIPEPDDFIIVTHEPGVDLKELQNNIIYPDFAKKAKIEGNVLLRILVDEKGEKLKVICEMTDSKMLTQAALNAVLKTKFLPAIKDEKPIIYWVSVPVNFKLKK